MTLARRCITVLWVVLLLPISFSVANAIQYGAKYDETLPLKTIGYVLETDNINGEILALKGLMSSQCQGDACWFVLKDNTGEVLVDLKPYDFRTPIGLVGKNVKLNGRVNTEGGKTQVDAISVIVE